MGKPDREKKLEGEKLKLRKGEQQKFERFKRAAHKLGLLVSEDAYIKYFRDSAELTEKK